MDAYVRAAGVARAKKGRLFRSMHKRYLRGMLFGGIVHFQQLRNCAPPSKVSFSRRSRSYSSKKSTPRRRRYTMSAWLRPN